jgi:TfoX/Sxy family transcriptional regulator of competence genes
MAADPFPAVAEAFAGDPGVATGRMFGSTGLKVGGKVFAMSVKGDLVVKLPKERVDELVAAGTGSPFDPGHGRLMKEWVSVSPRQADAWLALAREAKGFVDPR